MTIVFVVCAILGVGLIVLAATRKIGMLDNPTNDRRVTQLPAQEVTASDLEDLRIPVVLRGYRMDEVDALVARLGQELNRRDEHIASLQKGPN